jgi:hypothetical protein
MDLLEYSDVHEALEKIKHHYLLLGNGFSIALFPKIFTYGSLYQNADLEKHPSIESVFAALCTEDFELVIRYLVSASRIVSVYEGASSTLAKKLASDAGVLKEILVSAIARHHPDRPYDVEKKAYAACRNFISDFGHIYTLNYDVLLYWALMQDEVDDLDLKPDDGFRFAEDQPDAPWVSWQQANSPTVHYLHGALHLFDIETDIVKYTWSKTDVPIVDQIRASLKEEKYPLFVAEGTAASKRTKIMHNAYLHKALRSLEGCAKQKDAAFVVYGHSLASNDDHVLRMIERGRVPYVYVSLYGDPDSATNKMIIARAEMMKQNRLAKNPGSPLAVEFFDAESAHVWG